MTTQEDIQHVIEQLERMLQEAEDTLIPEDKALFHDFQETRITRKWFLLLKARRQRGILSRKLYAQQTHISMACDSLRLAKKQEMGNKYALIDYLALTEMQ